MLESCEHRPRVSARRAARSQLIVTIFSASCGPAVPAGTDPSTGESTGALSDASLSRGTDTSASTVDAGTTSTGADEASTSTTGNTPPTLSPPLRWVHQYVQENDTSLFNAIAIGGGDFLTIAGANRGRLYSLTDMDEFDFEGPGSFVARYDDAGTLQWARPDGGEAWRGTLAPDGGIVVAGVYDVNNVFGADEAEPIILPYEGGRAMYTARYANDGTLAWALGTEGGSSVVDPWGVALSPFDEFVVLGDKCCEPVLFQPSDSVVDAEVRRFLASYTLSGDAVSIDVEVQTYEQVSYEIGLRAGAFDIWGDGATALVGSFCGSLILGPGESNATQIESIPLQCSKGDRTPTNDAFVARYSVDGALDWALTALSPGAVELWDARITSDGLLLMRGWATEEVEVYDTAGLVTMLDAGNFIVAYDELGHLAWLRHIVSNEGGPALAVMSDGHVVALGLVAGAVVFDPDSENELQLPGSGIYAASYSAAGELMWAALVVEGSGASDLRLHQTGGGESIFALSGEFAGELVFAPDTLDETSLSSHGYLDHFMAAFEL